MHKAIPDVTGPIPFRFSCWIWQFHAQWGYLTTFSWKASGGCECDTFLNKVKFVQVFSNKMTAGTCRGSNTASYRCPRAFFQRPLLFLLVIFNVHACINRVSRASVCRSRLSLQGACRIAPPGYGLTREILPLTLIFYLSMVHTALEYHC